MSDFIVSITHSLHGVMIILGAAKTTSTRRGRTAVLSRKHCRRLVTLPVPFTIAGTISPLILPLLHEGLSRNAEGI